MPEIGSPDKNNRKRRWLLQAVGGLILTGTGLSMAIDAGFRKWQGDPWVFYGTVALIVFQSGLCLMADSVRFRD
ncbi:MAG: hypothetical protein ACK5VH_05060 [bacterium]|jgi:hypothetical protein|nr:hypothetical protein [Chitinophagaceae bacterium]